MTNSREKGKRGERELAALLSYHGFQAERAQQYKGGQHSADIHCPSMSMLGFHIECKRTEVGRLGEWWDKAAEEAGFGKTPVIFWRQNRGRWFAIFEAEAFLDWLGRMISGQEEDEPPAPPKEPA